MKKRFFWVVAVLLIAALPGAFAATETESEVQGRADGLHIGGKSTDRVAFGAATPVAQQAATVTPFLALQNLGLIATGNDYTIQHKTVALPADDIIAMYTTPVALIAAPGAGKSIVVQKVAFTITRTATAFTGGAAAIVQYDSTANGAGTQALDSTLASTVITGAAGTTVSLRSGAIISDLTSTSIQNKGLYISNGTAVFAAGTGTATVDVWYYIY